MKATKKKTTSKKSTKKSSLKSDREALINRGEAETKNLAECLNVDFATLFASIFSASSKSGVESAARMKELGILKRMNAMAELILEEHGESALEKLAHHKSDTARSWAAFIVGRIPRLTLKKRLEKIKPYADDSHFGVREWAWMAVRNHIAEDLEQALTLLAEWTNDRSFRVRRFASEATRPRGVWAAHIQALKDKPEMGIPILAPLKADPERYVQDSVANWLNDAAKTQPGWVKQICSDWAKSSPSPATSYVIKRALRSIKSK